MVTIRLARFGRKKGPFYRIVAVDSSKKATGANLEVLGYWNPSKKVIKVEKEKVAKWVATGAKISPAVQKLMK